MKIERKEMNIVLKSILTAAVITGAFCTVSAFAQDGAEEGVWDKTKNVASDVWDGTKEVSSDVWDGTKEVTSDVWNGTKQVGSDIKKGLTDDMKPTSSVSGCAGQ